VDDYGYILRIFDAFLCCHIIFLCYCEKTITYIVPKGPFRRGLWSPPKG
jgi:hypothetical protein